MLGTKTLPQALNQPIAGLQRWAGQDCTQSASVTPCRDWHYSSSHWIQSFHALMCWNMPEESLYKIFPGMLAISINAVWDKKKKSKLNGEFVYLESVWFVEIKEC